MTIGMLVIWSLSHLDHSTCMPCSMGSAGMRAPVWTASCMGHWKRLFKISGGTDCYYCINKMTCLLHVYYCLVVLVTIPDNLSTTMFLMWSVYFIPLPDTYYTFCGSILLMYTYTLHFTYFLFHIYSSCTHYSYTLMTL